MLLRTLYTHSTGIAYKHSCCSWAALLVIGCTLATVLLPLFVAYAINGDLWSTQLLHHSVLARPIVAFSYRYMLVAEFSGQRRSNATGSPDNESIMQTSSSTQEDEGPDLIVSSSYSFFNELTQPFQRSIAMKHWTDDGRRNLPDRRPATIQLQFTFPPPHPAQRLAHLSLYLDFDGMLGATSQTHCATGDIPTAMIVARQPVGQLAIGANTIATIDGTLVFRQTANVACSSAGRSHRRTLFDTHRLLIPENSTDYRDYEPDTLRRRLRRSGTHMEFVADVNRISVRPVAAETALHGNMRLEVRLDVAEFRVRYATNVWQQVFAIWMQYLAVLALVALVARQLVSLAFRRRWVRAWEVVPWKKLH